MGVYGLFPFRGGLRLRDCFELQARRPYRLWAFEQGCDLTDRRDFERSAGHSLNREISVRPEGPGVGVL